MTKKDLNNIEKLVLEMNNSIHIDEYDAMFVKLRDKHSTLFDEMTEIEKEISEHQSMITQLKKKWNVLNHEFAEISKQRRILSNTPYHR
jgi:uncharacterized protein YdcH (DUF465 family)